MLATIQTLSPRPRSATTLRLNPPLSFSLSLHLHSVNTAVRQKREQKRQHRTRTRRRCVGAPALSARPRSGGRTTPRPHPGRRRKTAAIPTSPTMSPLAARARALSATRTAAPRRGRRRRRSGPNQAIRGGKRQRLRTEQSELRLAPFHALPH